MRSCRLPPMLEAVLLALVFALALAAAVMPAGQAPITPPVITAPAGAAAGEQKDPATKAAATLVASFDGLGAGSDGPQGASAVRNPSDNSLAVGPNHIVQ